MSPVVENNSGEKHALSTSCIICPKFLIFMSYTAPGQWACNKLVHIIKLIVAVALQCGTQPKNILAHLVRHIARMG